MAWRSNPKLYKWFYEQNEPLEWREHYTWWKSRVDRIDWIIVYDGKFRKRDVGSVNVSKLESKYPEIGILIGEITLWGKGIGKKSLNLALNYLKENDYNGATANILKDNSRSEKLFKGLGFKKINDNKDDKKGFRISFKKQSGETT